MTQKSDKTVTSKTKTNTPKTSASKRLLPHLILVSGLLITTSVIVSQIKESSSQTVVKAQNESASFKEKPTTAKSLDSLTKNTSQSQQQNAHSLNQEQEFPFQEQEVKLRLAQIATSFEEDIQYPHFSKPILDSKGADKYKPNRSTEASMPLDLANEDGPGIALKTSKLQYFENELIQARAYLNNAKGDERVAVTGRIVYEGQTIATADGRSYDNSSQDFELPFQLNQEAMTKLPSSDENQIMNIELRVVASFNIDGKSFEIGAPIQYSDAIAEISHVGNSYVQNEYLNIPIEINTQDLGFHQLSGTLYNAENERPIVHLSAQKDLLTHQDSINLTAHIAALKAVGSEGPYLLRDISLTRMPSPPRYTTEYGKANQREYRVDGYPFQEYNDVPYTNAEAIARLDFLKQFSQVQ